MSVFPFFWSVSPSEYPVVHHAAGGVAGGAPGAQWSLLPVLQKSTLGNDEITKDPFKPKNVETQKEENVNEYFF